MEREGWNFENFQRKKKRGDGVDRKFCGLQKGFFEFFDGGDRYEDIDSFWWEGILKKYERFWKNWDREGIRGHGSI